MRRMIGIGMPISQSKRPRPMISSCCQWDRVTTLDAVAFVTDAAFWACIGPAVRTAANSAFNKSCLESALKARSPAPRMCRRICSVLICADQFRSKKSLWGPWSCARDQARCIHHSPAITSMKAGPPTKAAYLLLRRSVARACSSASRPHSRAISIKVSRGGPDGTMFASSKHSRASCRYSSALLVTPPSVRTLRRT
jgi:hypothetical protein